MGELGPYAYGLDGRGSTPGSGKRFFSLFSTASRSALGPNQPLIQWVPGALFPVVKIPGCEADNSPPSNAEVKSGGAVPSLPVTSSCTSAEISTGRTLPDLITKSEVIYTISGQSLSKMRFAIITAFTMKVTVFRDMMSYLNKILVTGPQ
jgi:hypothetical protein